jgi:hypothetical protein
MYGIIFPGWFSSKAKAAYFIFVQCITKYCFLALRRVRDPRMIIMGRIREDEGGNHMLAAAIMHPSGCCWSGMVWSGRQEMINSECVMGEKLPTGHHPSHCRAYFSLFSARKLSTATFLGLL